MPDVFSKEKRSEVMGLIRSRGNKTTELALVLLFRKNKIKGWRRGSKLIGKPDFVFPKSRLVVFVDGCFWHGHGCRPLKPGANYDYWNQKILRNKKRDRLITKRLKEQNWNVVRVWECEIRKKNYDKKLSLIQRYVDNGEAK